MHDTNKLTHLGFIQNIITRMGTNSFLIKAWSVTLVAALFTLASKDANKSFMVLAYFPVLFFWILDAYFFHQELLFRKLYEKVAIGEISSDEFTLKISNLKADVPCMLDFISARILCYFHAVIFLVVSFAMWQLAY